MKSCKKISLLCLVVGLMSCSQTQKYNSTEADVHKQEKSGFVIILNGPSASGKSSIQRELQNLFPKPLLKLGIDNSFIGVMPSWCWDGSGIQDATQVMTSQLTKDQAGNPIFTLTVEPEGEKIISGMHHAIAAYAKSGNNVIVDYILYNPAWIKELVIALDGLIVYLVGIHLPLETLEEREKARATSPVGHARSHHDTVHEYMHNCYDIEINSAKQSWQESALLIKKFIDTHAQPMAFGKLKNIIINS